MKISRIDDGDNKEQFFNDPPPLQYQNENRPTSQPEVLLDEHGTAALVGSLTFFYFGTNQGS